MNRRQRFLETMTFGSPDRPASGDYFYYDATRERWEAEGLPGSADLNEYFGMDFDPFRWQILGHPAVSPIPDFGTTVLEESRQYQVVRRPDGATVRILRDVPPPAMPQWLAYARQILIANDICLKCTLHHFGGWGYDHILRNIVPMMLDAGIDQATIGILLEGNPRRLHGASSR